MEGEENSTTRFIVYLEDSVSGRMARVAFPNQALYERYLKKKEIPAKEANCAYVELEGEYKDELHVFYCKWLDGNDWELSGYSIDGKEPVFPMKPAEVKISRIPIASVELVESGDSFANRAKTGVSKVSKQLSRPIQALEMSLFGEIKRLPFSFLLVPVLVFAWIVTFFLLRSEPPKYVEGASRAPWLMVNLTNVSYFDGDGRIVFEGEMEPRAAQRSFRGLEIIPRDESFEISRYTLYRDAANPEDENLEAYWNEEGYDNWRKRHFVNIQFGMAMELPNGSKIAYNLVTKRLYGNLRSLDELNEFTAERPKAP